MAHFRLRRDNAAPETLHSDIKSFLHRFFESNTLDLQRRSSGRPDQTFRK
jgi:hypothetical protein